jgi:hypothetical protein
MAKVLLNTGISNGNAVEPWQISQSVDAFTGIEAYDITISGSLNLSDDTMMFGTSSMSVTSSHSETSISSSYALTSSYALNTGGVLGTTATTQVPYGIGVNTLGSNSGFTYTLATNTLTIGKISGNGDLLTGTASSLNIGGNASTATNVAYSGLTGTVPTWNQDTTGQSSLSQKTIAVSSSVNTGVGNLSLYVGGGVLTSGTVTITDHSTELNGKVLGSTAFCTITEIDDGSTTALNGLSARIANGDLVVSDKGIGGESTFTYMIWATV